jgi:hypothetical protein
MADLLEGLDQPSNAAFGEERQFLFLLAERDEAEIPVAGPRTSVQPVRGHFRIVPAHHPFELAPAFVFRAKQQLDSASDLFYEMSAVAGARGNFGEEQAPCAGY